MRVIENQAIPQQVLVLAIFANTSPFHNLVLKLWRHRNYLYSSQISPRLKCTVCISAKKFVSKSRGSGHRVEGIMIFRSSALFFLVLLQTVHSVIYPWTSLVSGQTSFCHLAFSQAPSFPISQCKH